MANLNAEANYEVEVDRKDTRYYPVAASTKLWAWGAVTNNAGAGNVGVLSVNEQFMGFVTGTYDNSSGAAAALGAWIATFGVAKLPVVGATGAGNYGAEVYAYDNQTFSLAPSGGLLIGKVVQWVNGTICRVKFWGEAERFGSF